MNVSHPYFVRQNTERAAKVHFFLHLLSSSPENLPLFSRLFHLRFRCSLKNVVIL